MPRTERLSLAGCLLLALLSAGCRWPWRAPSFHAAPHAAGDASHYQALAASTDYADLGEPPGVLLAGATAPRLLGDETPPEYWDLSLAGAVETALRHSTVVRDLGGRVLDAPQATATSYDPALRASDPRIGVAAALAAFDAEASTGLFWARNDRAVNNIFYGLGVNEFRQEGATGRAEIAKRLAAGGRVALRGTTDYDANNSPFNLFPSAWGAAVETEFRQPLLEGAGREVNDIAGPETRPGEYRGVVLARIDGDVGQADFEAAVTDLVRDVERGYWELYFAFRDLDAKRAARDSAYETWQNVRRKLDLGAEGGDEEAEARAAEQYYQFQALVEDALAGTPGDPRGGPATGVHAQEARLRLLMGIPAADGRLIRPSDAPPEAELLFDWAASLDEALSRRVELRRQRLQVRRRQLEFVAARNHTLPRLDAVALYRWRGLGDDLLADGDGRYAGALDNLADGDFQEWQLGVEASVPLGRRAGLDALRHAELMLARERAILADQELHVEHELSAALRELDRARRSIETTHSRREAARAQLAAVRRKYDAGMTSLDFVLESEQRQAEAESGYHRATVDYALAGLRMQAARGAVLESHLVGLAK